MVRVFRPASLDEAVRIRSSGNTTIMSGGTDLMVKHRAVSGTISSFASDVLYIGRLEELKGIKVDFFRAEIGAATTLSDILADHGIPNEIKAPLSQIGSPAIRNMATIGGNICNASPAGDSLPMLYALGAELKIRSSVGVRLCGIADFLTGPGKTTLRSDEILESISVPLERWTAFYYKKVGQRKANAVAKLSFYGAVRAETGVIEDIRMAFGAVAPVVIRIRDAEEALIGGISPSCHLAEQEAMDLIGRALSPIDDMRSNKEYRFKVSMALAERFIKEAICG